MGHYLISKMCFLLAFGLFISFVLTLFYGEPTWSGSLAFLFFLCMLVICGRFYRKKGDALEAYIKELNN